MIAKTALNNAVQQQIGSMIAAAYWSLQATFVRPPPHRDGAPRTLLPPPTPCSMGFALLLHGNPRLSSIAFLHGIPPPPLLLPCIVWQLYWLPAVGGHYGGRLDALPLLQEDSPHEVQLRGSTTRSRPVRGRGGVESWMSQRKHDRSLAGFVIDVV